ncbi:MAG: fibrobacter succinogenes major paralogous domain-containing protein [Bacteroidota bacterium]
MKNILISMTFLMLMIPFCMMAQDIKTVKIGSQEWTDANLNVSKFKNGDIIPEAKNIEEFIQACSDLKPIWINYENETANGTVYGKIYNYYAVQDSRGLAPVGFHIPTDAEWKQMIDELGGSDNAGKKLKSIKGWDENGNGDNKSGFNALPGGELNGGYAGNEFVPEFREKGSYTCFWASDKSSMFIKPNRCLSFQSDVVETKSSYLNYGFYVRCVKD